MSDSVLSSSTAVFSSTTAKLSPLDAHGIPLSLETVSLCDTTSESYGSCKCWIIFCTYNFMPGNV
jgi:hypothetical protein